MKHLKLFENFNDIDSICEKFGIENYTINPDGSIDVQGNVDLSDMGLTKLPLRFGNVSGDFYCGNNQLISLEGAPQVVGRNFYCNDNQLTSLEGAPQKVGRNFTCSQNPVEVIWNLFKDYSMIDLFNDYDPIRDDKVIVLDRLNSFLKDIGKPTVTEVKGYKCI